MSSGDQFEKATYWAGTPVCDQPVSPAESEDQVREWHPGAYVEAIGDGSLIWVWDSEEDSAGDDDGHFLRAHYRIAGGAQ